MRYAGHLELLHCILECAHDARERRLPLLARCRRWLRAAGSTARVTGIQGVSVTLHKSV
jgi:hypothetical protein